MLQRGTPGRSKPAEFLSTPARQARRLSQGSAPGSSPAWQVQSPMAIDDQVFGQFATPETLPQKGKLSMGPSDRELRRAMTEPKSGSHDDVLQTSEASDRATTIQDTPLESEGPSREEETETNEAVRRSPNRRVSIISKMGELGGALAQTAATAAATTARQTAVTMTTLTTLAGGVSEYTDNMFAPTTSKGLAKHVQTDEASFNLFLDQVIKAHVEGGADPRHRRGKDKRDLTGILEGDVSGGFFQRCPRTQALCYKFCVRAEHSVLFGLFCWAFLLLHCIALVQVANKAGSEEFWYTVSESYMAFFILELIVRIAAAPNRYFWQSGFVVLDIVLVLASVVEALLPSISDQFSRGQFTLLILHVLRFLRGLQSLNMPESASAVTACFGGLLPVFVFVLLGCIWSFLAIVWYLVFNNTTTQPIQFSDFGSSVLTQFYLACHGTDWDRITSQLTAEGTQTASAIALAFGIVLTSVVFFTANAAVILFHELADKGIAEYREYDRSQQMRRRLLGLHRFEHSLKAAACRNGGVTDDSWAEWLMQSRSRLESTLEELQNNELRVLSLSVTEILQLYDHLFEVNHGDCRVSELLFGILRMISPAEVAEFLQVDHLQKQCTQVAEAAAIKIEREVETSRQHLDVMEQSVSRLRTQLQKLRSQAGTAKQELKGMVSEVEQQYQDCIDSVNQAASIRRLHLQLTHKNSRQEVFNEVYDAQRSLSRLYYFNHYCTAFGFPSVGSEAAWAQAAEDSRRAFGDSRHFDKTTRLLQAEVKKRVETRLKEHLKLRTDPARITQRGSPAAMLFSTPGSGGVTPCKPISTPSRLIDIRTPLRPCSRQRSKEFQDDVRVALEEQSAELLRVALQRRHACPRDHALHEAVRQAGFDRSLMIDISDDLLGSGLCVWNVDYRSVGSGGGYPSTLEDVASAFNWLGSDEAVSLGVHPNLPVGIVGHSAGGHLAAWLAIQGLLDRSDFDLSGDIKPRIVVAQAGVLDLKGAYEANLGRSAVRDFMGTPPASAASRMLAASNGAVLDIVASPADDADLRYSRADPTELLRKVSAARLTSGAPVFALVHGQGDDIVPTAQSVAFQSALRQCNGSDQCICNLIRGEGHFEHLHPIHLQGNCAATRLLLQNMAEPNERCRALERGCELPLQLALSSNLVRASERQQMVELLLQARADPELRRSDAEGSPPLHDAVRLADAGIVELLLRHRADPNSRNSFSEAPLDLALGGSRFLSVDLSLSLVEVLLKWGACPTGLSGEATCQRTEGVKMHEGSPVSDDAALVPEIQILLSKWTAWWRLRMLAWIRSRGRVGACRHISSNKDAYRTLIWERGRSSPSLMRVSVNCAGQDMRERKACLSLIISQQVPILSSKSGSRRHNLAASTRSYVVAQSTSRRYSCLAATQSLVSAPSSQESCVVA
ncbi:TNKS2 [Symbiodinium necroappetens]|uniref:TNKS2 protein n=1 Tax=Symbiodinium necroappetens TaxID=1628268 RepID=A0A813B9S9_9DINO|nr:TNKS2 [Symbiodinium necroappetens]